VLCRQEKQESRAVARKPRDAVAVLFGLKFADNIHYKFKSSQASNARLQSSKHTGTNSGVAKGGMDACPPSTLEISICLPSICPRSKFLVTLLDAKQNLLQNGHSRSFKVTCFGVSGKAIRDYK